MLLLLSLLLLHLRLRQHLLLPQLLLFKQLLHLQQLLCLLLVAILSEIQLSKTLLNLAVPPVRVNLQVNGGSVEEHPS